LIQVTRTKKINRHEEIISKSTRPIKKGAWVEKYAFVGSHWYYILFVKSYK